MKKKQSTITNITNLLVIPLIASAIFLAGPALADDSNPSSASPAPHTVRHKTNIENIPNVKKGVAGTVASITGTILIIHAKNNMEYTVDASHATLMKATDQNGNANPTIANLSDIKIGDVVLVRGVIKDLED